MKKTFELSTNNGAYFLFISGKISSQKALLVCVKNRGSSGGEQSVDAIALRLQAPGACVRGEHTVL